MTDHARNGRNGRNGSNGPSIELFPGGQGQEFQQQQHTHYHYDGLSRQSLEHQNQPSPPQADPDSLARFPPLPYASWPQLRNPSFWTQTRKLIQPFVAFAHVPATLFLDFITLFALAQVAAHPDSTQSGVRLAWWIALAVYSASTFVWLFGILILHDFVYQYKRRWSVQRPFVLPIYLSAPAAAITAFRSYTLFSLLHRVRHTATRRDFAIESFWRYSQNWPTVLTLLPRAVIATILLVLYRPSGPGQSTVGERDSSFFQAPSSQLTNFAFIIIIINAAWAAWRLGLLLVAWLGLLITLGSRSVFEQERRLYYSDKYDGAPNQEHRPDSPHGHAKWEWKLRAEERIRNVLYQASASEAAWFDFYRSQSAMFEQVEYQPQARYFADHNVPSPSLGQIGQAQSDSAAFHQYQYQRQQQQQQQQQQQHQHQERELDHVDQNAIGVAITSTEPSVATPVPILTTFPALRHSQEIEPDRRSDPYSPAPEPIGRSPRSREQLRSATSSRSNSSSMMLQNIIAASAAGGESQSTSHDSQPARLAPPAAPQDPSPPEEDDSPILAGRMQIVSYISSSDYPSTEAAVSAADVSPDMRGLKRPRSPPSDPDTSGEEPRQQLLEPAGQDLQVHNVQVPFASAAAFASKRASSSSRASPFGDAATGSDTKHSGLSPSQLQRPIPQAETRNSSRSSLASSLRGLRSRNNSRPSIAGEAAVSSDDMSSVDAGAGAASSGSRPARPASGGEVWWSSLLSGGPMSSVRRKRRSLTSDKGSDADQSPSVSAVPLPGPSSVDTSPLQPTKPLVITKANKMLADTNNLSAEPDSVADTETTKDTLALAPACAAGTLQGDRSASPAESRESFASSATDDSEERRLWASFPEQSRRHPPGLIALNLEQQSRASDASRSIPIPAPTPIDQPEFAHSPSGGGLHAIREESWSSSLDSPTSASASASRSNASPAPRSVQDDPDMDDVAPQHFLEIDPAMGTATRGQGP